MTVTQHLRSRHVNLSLHRPYVDESERVATFLLWNLSGAVVGYQRYRPDATKMQRNDPREGRYFTRCKQPTVAVWGIESLELDSSLLFVTEGIFDAARLTERGFPAVAVLTCDPPTSTRNWLTCLSRRIVFVQDPDKAGAKLKQLGFETVSVPGGTDLSASSNEDVNKMLNSIHLSTRLNN